ncbi:MAG: hypothetical protein R3Y23_01935 [Bacillota bacterium]
MVKKAYRYFFIALTAFAMIMLIYKPEKYMNAVYDGIILFCVSVLPAMFPFFFFSKLLTGLGGAEILSRITCKPIKKLYNAHDVGGYILAMSLLSGYPIGAKLVADSYKNGIVDTEECKKLISFTSTTGPIFVLGTIGSYMLDNYVVGVVILVAHYLSALINGLLYRGKRCDKKEHTREPTCMVYDNLLADSINSSLASVLAVGGYIAIFNLVIVILGDLGVFSALSSLLLHINIPTALTESLAMGIVEVTRGALTISTSNLPLIISVPTLTFIVTFGGLSITIQSLTFLQSCNITAGYYLKTKITQAIIATLIAIPLAFLI